MTDDREPTAAEADALRTRRMLEEIAGRHPRLPVSTDVVPPFLADLAAVRQCAGRLGLDGAALASLAGAMGIDAAPLSVREDIARGVAGRVFALAGALRERLDGRRSRRAAE